MDDPDAMLPVESAGRLAGIPPRTLRSWVRAGKLPATEGQRGRLVRLGDVLAIAEVTGRPRASRRQTAGSHPQAFGPATSAGNPATLPAIVEAQRASLEAIRDEWIRPLVDDLRAAERAIGRLEAEREQATVARAAAELERDALAAEVARLRAVADTPEERQDAPHATEPAGAVSPPPRPWWRFWGR